jgi:hypothetical protein
MVGSLHALLCVYALDKAEFSEQKQKKEDKTPRELLYCLPGSAAAAADDRGNSFKGMTYLHIVRLWKRCTKRYMRIHLNHPCTSQRL